MEAEKLNSEAAKVIRLKPDRADFADRVIRRSGVNINLCWHCKCCGGGCPFSASMDFYPNQVIRLVQLGLKDEALASSAIWICVGCNTCSMECPQGIDMAAVMDAMREIAILEDAEIAEPDILTFHNEMIHSILRHGRAHKLEIMLRYKMKKRDWFSDVNLGLRMLANRKLDLMPSRVKNPGVVKKIFDISRQTKKR